jgi:HEPN domain
MLSRRELKDLSRARLADAKVLLERKRYDGALYLCGYAVELAIKARICTTLKWERYQTGENFRSFKTHDFGSAPEFKRAALQSAGQVPGGMVERAIMETRNAIRTHRNGKAKGRAGSDSLRRGGIVNPVSVIAGKLAGLASEIRSDKGEIDVLALFLRESAEAWDLVFGAPWATSDKLQAMRYLYKGLSRILNKQEREAISRIVILEQGAGQLTSLMGGGVEESSIRELGRFNYNDVPVQSAYVVVAKPPTARNGRVA